MNKYSVKIRIIISTLLFVMINSFVVKGQADRTHEMKISGLQMDVSDDIVKNKDLILEGIRSASGAGSDFLVTPEGSLSGYTPEFNQDEVDKALKEILKKAAENKVGLMLGTCYKEKSNGKEYVYNQVRIYAPDGNFIGAYSKILRCSNLEFPGTGEMTDYVEGDLKVFSWKDISFGILICNDLWATPGYTTIPNPYLPWKLKQMGSDVIIHCINSGTNQRYRNFHESSAELWALSLRLPVLEVNAAHGNGIINAQSGLIENDGKRSLLVPDSGNQFFTVSIKTR